jgi:hypothetical protein
MSIETTDFLWGIWGSSGSDVFAVGWSGNILHYDGTTWSSMSKGTHDGFNAVWGSSGSDVFVVGATAGGYALHYDGNSWSACPIEVRGYLNAIWGSSASDIFAAGYTWTDAYDYFGTILHYDGTSWSPMSIDVTTYNLRGIWGSSRTDVFAVGNPGDSMTDGIILHYSGAPTLITLSSFTATSSGRKVILEWSTASEIDNAGFNLYRAESENGEYMKINDNLIPAEGSATQGATYQFIDDNVKNRTTYYYKLEDIDTHGTSTMHGPVSATPRLISGIGK